ncbi:LysR family transcriptional regulator [Aurantimonas sp. Leaf443]|uniref:LysR family transcriptional regulator n=1 Tax=Aurantimonas sp. Leaf443 TaxID=1736378 RepID=UPI000700F885|nr:LysR family transcriptional regulator [Aurantimonas sp. Leaf443]KQT86201.1 hypothetical protein ASG48_06435 [Aurantimonas sp. Leaf443]
MVRFTLRQCAYFRAVACEGGIAQAARAMNISQPSVAQALAKLEDVTGLRLFERHHARGATLTAEGRAFLAHVEALELQAEQVAREAAALAAEVSGEIRLGCFHTLAAFYMAGLVRSHLDAYPGVRIRAQELGLAPLADALREGSLDAGLTYDLGGDLRGLDLTELAAIRPSVVVAADHPVARLPSVSLNDLGREPYVMFDGPGSRGYFEALLAEHAIDPPVAYVSTSLEAVRSAVGNGFGFTLLVMHPDSNLSYDRKPLAVVPIRDAVRPLRIVLATRGGAAQSALARRFAIHARQHFESRHG